VASVKDRTAAMLNLDNAIDHSGMAWKTAERGAGGEQGGDYKYGVMKRTSIMCRTIIHVFDPEMDRIAAYCSYHWRRGPFLYVMAIFGFLFDGVSNS
jgi:hypothetical protein